MKNYLNLGKKLIKHGETVHTRTGTVRSLTGQSLSFDLRKGFPLLTTKYINFKHIKTEVDWYLLGTDSIKYLKDNGVNIWNNWADAQDSIGKTYGYQWIKFNDDTTRGNQVANVIKLLKEDPFTRRALINGWNPLQLHEMRLPPCIVNLHFISRPNSQLDLVVYQRSADFCLGVPYDIAEMALLLHMIADKVGMIARRLTISFGDVHIYENHIETFEKEQLPIMPSELPKLIRLRMPNEISYSIHWPGTAPSNKIKYPISI